MYMFTPLDELYQRISRIIKESRISPFSAFLCKSSSRRFLRFSNSRGIRPVPVESGACQNNLGQSASERLTNFVPYLEGRTIRYVYQDRLFVDILS